MSGSAGWWRSSATINKTKQKTIPKDKEVKSTGERREKVGEAIQKIRWVIVGY